MTKKITAATEEILKKNSTNKKPAKKSEESMTAMGHTAWRMKLEGNSYREIGLALGVSTAKIKHYIQGLMDEYKMEIFHDIEEFRQGLAIQLMHMNNETNKLWNEAKRDFSVSPSHVVYLESSRKMIKDVRDLLGLDSPKRTELEVSSGEVPYTITLNLDGKTN